MRSFLKRQGLIFRDFLTEAPGHAVELAHDALARGCGTVVAVGGDGTVNEVVNGLVDGTDIGYGRVPPVRLGVISRGTGSDLARTLGLGDPVAAMRALTERQTTKTIDVGEIIFHGEGEQQRRLFVNVAGLGFDGEVVEDLLARSNAGKELGGTLPYLMQVVRTVLHYRVKNIQGKVDDLELNGLYTSVFACNGKYLAGGMKIAPEADPTDGLLDVVIIKALSSPGLLLRLPLVYLGWHTHLGVVEIHRARELTVDTEDRLLIEADGELVGMAPATVRVVPQALQVRV